MPGTISARSCDRVLVLTCAPVRKMTSMRQGTGKLATSSAEAQPWFQQLSNLLLVNRAYSSDAWRVLQQRYNSVDPPLGLNGGVPASWDHLHRQGSQHIAVPALQNVLGYHSVSWGHDGWHKTAGEIRKRRAAFKYHQRSSGLPDPGKAGTRVKYPLSRRMHGKLNCRTR